MTFRGIPKASLLLILAAGAACAVPPAPAPPTAVPPPVPQVEAPRPEAPGPALPEEEHPYAVLLREDPALAAATTDLAAASPAARPAALLRRAHAAFTAARRLLAEQGGPFGAVWPPDRERRLAYCGLALSDLEELLAAHPRSPEAPEAMFTVGQINDFPNLNAFDDALAAYRQTVDRYPSTPWAARARERITLIESLVGAVEGSPHGTPPATAPPAAPTP